MLLANHRQRACVLPKGLGVFASLHFIAAAFIAVQCCSLRLDGKILHSLLAAVQPLSPIQPSGGNRTKLYCLFTEACLKGLLKTNFFFLSPAHLCFYTRTPPRRHPRHCQGRHPTGRKLFPPPGRPSLPGNPFAHSSPHPLAPSCRKRCPVRHLCAGARPHGRPHPASTGRRGDIGNGLAQLCQ